MTEQEIRDRIAALERQVTDLQETNNRYLERARAAEAFAETLTLQAARIKEEACRLDQT